MSQLSNRIQNLSPEKRRLLELMLQARGGEPAAPMAQQPPAAPVFSLISSEDCALLPAGLEDAYPLSLLQQGMIYHSQLGPDARSYHNVSGFTLRGQCVPALLEQALALMVERHPILRTSFDLSTFSEPLQLVHKTAHIPLSVSDLSQLTPAEQAAALEQWVETDARQPFDLDKPPLLRLHIHQCGSDRFRFWITEHHAILDGWSWHTFLIELLELYAAAFKAEPPPAPPPAAPTFRHYIALERQALADTEQRSYWDAMLKDANVLRLPRWPDMPRADGAMGQHTVFVPLEPAVDHGLKQLGQRLGVPLKTVLLACHFRILQAITGETQITTGLIVHGRPELPGTEHMLGLFLNTLPLAQTLAGGTWEELIRATFAAEQQLLPRRWMPLAHLQRQYGGQPLFESLFNFVNYHTFQGLHAGASDAILTVEDDPNLKDQIENNFTFVANFSINPRTQDLELLLGYDQGELAPEQVEQIGAYYGNALRAMVRNPGERYQAASLIPSLEWSRVVRGWNGSPPTRFAGGLPALIAAQAARTPAATAVVAGESRLAYADLEAQANRLAHLLRARGVGPEVVVGVCMERTPALVVALLAVLKAGGAYLPLDPTYPAARREFMIRDAGAVLVLTQPSFLAGLPADVPTLTLDGAAAELAAAPSDPPLGAVNPSSLAYIIYTSGSTGTPKGVAIRHSSAATLVQWALETFSAAELAGTLASTSMCFDLSVFEVFTPLSCGGTVILVDNALAVMAAPTAVPVTLINTVPSVMAEMLQMGSLPASVRTIALAGEPLSGDLVRQLYAIDGIERVWNLYGPSEDTTYSTAACLPPAGDGKPSIGRPIDDTRAYVVDDWFNLAPIGTPGDLYLGGGGLARGYLRRPDLTADRFVPDPISGISGSRLYKTGDRARWLPGGVLEYLGRTDHQVKIRGHRIEPGEVERVLRLHSGLRDAVVIARSDGGEPQLAAYVIPADPAAIPTVSAIHQHVLGYLPRYMAPAAITFLEALPLTPNGKLDRRALPAPDCDRPLLAAHYTPPRNGLEAILAQIWMDVLGLDRVGVHDTFFELGGHSLLATRVVARMRHMLEMQIDLWTFFEAPTIAALAERLEFVPRATARSANIAPADRAAALSLSFAQQRLWFLQQLDPQSNAYNFPVALRLEGALDQDALKRAINTIVERHEIFRTTYVLQGERPIQRIEPALPIGLLPEDISALVDRDSQVQAEINHEARRPFDLQADPLVRLRLFRLGPSEHVLLFVTHHIAIDGWSVGILTNELLTLYAAFAAAAQPMVAPLPIQYADFAAWQREWLQGDALRQQLGYWQRQLAGAQMLALPTDRPRPPRQTWNGATHAWEVPGALLEDLRALSRKEGVTLFMTLLAGFQVLLARYTQQDDIAIGTPIANRTHPELEGVIGCFVNTLVLRTDLSGNPRFLELLGRVRQVTLEAYAHQDIPFERLVEELQPDRNVATSPFFQVMLVMQNTPATAATLSDLAITPLGLQDHSAKFDITLTFEESAAGLSGMWTYNTDLFDATSIARLSAHFQSVIEGIVADPGQRIGDLSLVTDAEYRQLVTGWNPPASTPLPPFDHWAAWFAAQVRRTPQAIAVSSENSELSYGALNQAANRLAHQLQARGIGPDCIVGLLADRGPELLIAIIAVLKAGGAYLPLDPEHPPQRLAQIVGQSQTCCILVDHGGRGTIDAMCALLPGAEAPQVAVISDLLADAAWPDGDPATTVGPANLAYVIYTSGSTGLPKGVMVEQRGMLNHLQAKIHEFSLDGSDRIVQNASQTFDISVWQYLCLLTVGGEVHVVSNAVAHDPRALLARVEQRRITVLQVVPSLLRAALDALDEPGAAAPELVDLRWIVPTGEALPTDLAQRWLVRYPSVPLMNAYGSTECTDDQCHYPIRRLADLNHAPVVAIGGPLANTQTYILDGRLQPVPVGVAGDLYIGGICVGRGYLRDPGRTAERFIPDPFASTPGARLYHSGDLARYRADGVIDFLGRGDHQVKVRGFRIELSEIEITLRQHPAVRDAVVMAHLNSNDERFLTAYITLRPGATADPAEVRAFLGESLAAYMIPPVILVLPRLPLSANGKVNRRALPVPGLERSDEIAYEAPRTPMESRLAGIWAGVLGLPQVGVHDNFFTLGGSSLLVIKLLARVRQETGGHLPVASMFTAATIASQAALLTGGPREESSHLVPIQPHGTRPPLFLIHPIGGHVLCYQHLASMLGPDQPVYGLQSPGVEGTAPLDSWSIADLAGWYEADIRRVQPEGPYALAGWSLGGVVAYELACRLQAQGERPGSLILIDVAAHSPAASASRALEAARFALDVLATGTLQGGAASDATTAALVVRFLHELGLTSPADILRTIGGDHAEATAAFSRFAGFGPEDSDPTLPLEARIGAIWSQLLAQPLDDPAEGLDQIKRLFLIYQRNRQALQGFTPAPYAGPLTLIVGGEQAAVASDPTLGWQAAAAAPITRHVVAGNHYTMLTPPAATTVAALLRQDIDRLGE